MLRRLLCGLCALVFLMCAPALANDFEYIKGVAVWDIRGDTGLVNEDGEVLIDFERIQISLYPNGEGWVSAYGADRLFRASDGQIRYFYRFPDGSEELLPDWTKDWAEVIPLDCEPKRYLGHYKGNDLRSRYALLDADGAVIRDNYVDSINDDDQLQYQQEWYLNDYELGIMIAERGGLVGCLSYTGEWQIEPTFETIREFSENLAAARIEGRKYGFIDPSGSFVIEPQFDEVKAFQNGYAVVSNRKDKAYRYGLIDVSGALVLPIEYDEVYSVDAEGSVRTKRNGEAMVYRLVDGTAEQIAMVGSDLTLEDYMPFKGSKVAKLDGEPTLTHRASGDYRHPRLDGATALFPVYAAFVEAVYPDKTRYSNADDAVVTCTKTNRAYERLIAGDADIIFCAGPSDQQIADAAAAGVEFELTPFGREAFVFIVNSENPLEDISLEQIRGVYSGEITRWDQLGIDGIGGIVAYQRPANSGSQTALERLMGDAPLMTAPQEYVSDGMGDILETVEYRNLPNAIGYSFRFFCTKMMDSGVKLLSIDGVAPTVENIQNGSYPQITTLYAITRKGDPNPNIRVFLDWITSKQGQELVEKSGYVGYTE